MTYNIFKFIFRIIFKVIYRVRVYGLENVLYNEQIIVCGNHWNNLDPLLISAFFPRKIHWMAKKELFKNKLLGSIIKGLGSFPVDREKADITSTKTALKYLKEGEVLGIFPEGTRVKNKDLNTVKGGTALLALRSNSKVVPVYIEGNYKLFSKMNIYIREAMELEVEDRKKLDNEDYEKLTKNIMKRIYEIGDGN